MNIDPEALFPNIKAAVRTAFAELAARSAAERLYAFALYIDEDAIMLCPTAFLAGYTQPLEVRLDQLGKTPQTVGGLLARAGAAETLRPVERRVLDDDVSQH
jgi:hypothetical protein